ncbi:MAG TPA: hypothetical protein ACFYEH_09520 [Candidatus Brocadiaceae bacterium]
MVDIFNIPNARLLPCRQKDVVMAAPRPPDVSFDSAKASVMGFKPLPLAEEFKKLLGMV